MQDTTLVMSAHARFDLAYHLCSQQKAVRLAAEPLARARADAWLVYNANHGVCQLLFTAHSTTPSTRQRCSAQYLRTSSTHCSVQTLQPQA
jgi:hypothetical protein